MKTILLAFAAIIILSTLITGCRILGCPQGQHEVIPGKPGYGCEANKR